MYGPILIQLFSISDAEYLISSWPITSESALMISNNFGYIWSLYIYFLDKILYVVTNIRQVDKYLCLPHHHYHGAVDVLVFVYCDLSIRGFPWSLKAVRIHYKNSSRIYIYKYYPIHHPLLSSYSTGCVTCVMRNQLWGHGTA